MRRLVFAALLAASTSVAIGEPTPKEQLLAPPKDAAHFVVVSTAGKHGDEYMWALPDGRTAFRQSILLRGLVFETDETMRFGADGMPAEVVIRGVTPSGDAAEKFVISNGSATWVSAVDKGSAAYSAPTYYLAQGGPFLSTAPEIDRLLAKGRVGLALLPSGKATFEKVTSLDVDGPQGRRHVDLILLKGTSQTPQPVWVTDTVYPSAGTQKFGALKPPGKGTTVSWTQSGSVAAATSCTIVPPAGNGNGMNV